MRDLLFNYTSLVKRDQKIYEFGGTTISQSGISVSWLTVVAPTTVLGILVGILICVITGRNYFNPLQPYFSEWFIILTVGSGFGLGQLLYHVRVQNYRLYEWLFAVLRPKYIYNNSTPRVTSGRQRYTNIKIEGIVGGKY